MPDPAPTPPPPAPAPGKPKRTRSGINQADAAELTLAGELAATAAKPAYAAKLADEGIDAPFLTNLGDKIAEAQSLLASAGGKKADRKSTTLREEELKADLLELIGVVQSRAKRKYKTGDPQRAKYLIGQPVESSRAMLESGTRTILENLDEDDLPGMKPADVAALRDALTAYCGVQTDQSGDQSAASSARGNLSAKVKEVADLRREIQYAADAAWPAGKKANAPIRAEFQIPPDKAMK